MAKLEEKSFLALDPLSLTFEKEDKKQQKKLVNAENTLSPLPAQQIFPCFFAKDNQ